MRVSFVVPFLLAFTASATSSAPARTSPSEIDAICRPFYHDACSEALGRWLPRVPDTWDGPPRARTDVVDTIVDPAGVGREVGFDLRGVYGGTFFVHGEAGPPKGSVVYDPIHRLAYYDEGCCSWHHVVLAANVSPPPKPVTTRSLVPLRTARGIRLGDSPQRVLASYGPARSYGVRGVPGRTTLRYTRALSLRGVSSTCEADTTFLFERERLIGMDVYHGC